MKAKMYLYPSNHPYVRFLVFTYKAYETFKQTFRAGTGIFLDSGQI